jgi:hypothetical protein
MNKFLNKVELNIPFYDWFHAYTITNNIYYRFETNIIREKTLIVITVWHLKNGESIQSEFTPNTNFRFRFKSEENFIMASLFKIKLD